MNISSRVFVTGATGFIGSNLSAALHDRHVHVLARAGADLTILSSSPKVTIHRYDGTTQSVIDAFNGARPELVIHLAACFVAEHESDDIERLIESNILLGAQVLEGMLVTGARALINTGTSWQHFEDD
jgi:nucleoside-diphosphate-sugar epimerase